MNKLSILVQRLTYSERPKLDALFIFLGLGLATALDLTAFPETLAVLGYQIMLLVAATAIIHLIFIRRLKKQTV